MTPQNDDAPSFPVNGHEPAAVSVPTPASLSATTGSTDIPGAGV
ncbi:hypothetical protein QFZ52_002237 [Arthrobacter woluwensis]|nr:hypothetical protein [Arthrobacter woluwensis]MDQ0709585.1 hypothetical protein [Arthrobacter woluwensis]